MLGWSSEVECNPKTNILFFNDLGGLFHFFAFQSTFFAQITQPIIRSWTSTKNKHFIFRWLRGPLSYLCLLVNVFCSDRSAGPQKLNVIQKQTFYFSMTLGAFFIFFCFGQRYLLRSLGRSSEVEHNPKMNILFFDDLGGLLHFFAFRLTVFAQIAWLIIRSWT